MRPRRRRIEDVGEHRWLRHLLGTLSSPRASHVLIGPGDDAAVLRSDSAPWVVTTDAQREGVHFRAGWASWPTLGRRAFRVAVSDLAAMGAAPRAALLAVEVPRHMDVGALTGFVRGFAAEGRRRGAPLVGGDVSAAPRFGATMTLLGVLRGRAVTRTGARPGDILFVTGRLGATAAAVRRLRAGQRTRLPMPPDRLQAGLALAPIASAMLDVSDGLLQDLGHLCSASRVGAVLELERLPLASACGSTGRRGRVLAATGGEDYELLFTVSPARVARLADAQLGCAVTRIGTIHRGRGVQVLDARGRSERIRHPGFDHFR
jgi:thiamine-monophosphate kinase